MSENLFYESFLIIQYILGNKIKAITLVDIYATGFGFINKKFVEMVYKRLEIQPKYLTKPKFIQRFDGRAAKPITHTIYLILSMEKYIKSLASLLNIKFS